MARGDVENRLGYIDAKLEGIEGKLDVIHELIEKQNGRLRDAEEKIKEHDLRWASIKGAAAAIGALSGALGALGVYAFEFIRNKFM